MQYERLTRNVALIGIAVAAAAGNACGLFSTESATYTIRADSIVVDPGASTPESVAVRVVGYVGASGCAQLKSVDKSASGDSLKRTFIGESHSGNCIQMPVALDYVEQLASLPQRTVTYVVVQPSGPPLVKVISLPAH